MLKVFNDITGIATGVALTVAICVVGYLGYIALKRGLPAAKAIVVGWWNKGKADATSMQNVVADLQTRAVKAEQDIAALKSKVGL